MENREIKNSTHPLKAIFRGFRYRNFRLFFAGQSVSLVGTWMQQVAMSWLVYRMTGSAFILGVIGFAAQIPAFVVSPFAGVMVDRLSRHKILIVAQVLFMVEAFILAYLTLAGIIAVWHIIVLGIIFGCVTSIEIPCRQSFIMELVEKKENLGNAIALNSFMFNAGRFIGPSIAGLLIAVTSEGFCFFANGLSFLAVIGSLLMMHIKPYKKEINTSQVFESIKEGFKYAFGFLPIRYILIILSVNSAVGMSYVVLMPIFAKEILKGDATILGFLMAAAGVGSLVSTIYLASRKNIVGLDKLMPISSAIFSAGLILFSFSKSLWLSLLSLSVVGFGFMTHMAACNIILQTIADDDKRGRVMSFYTMAFLGVAPAGSIGAGALASKIGAPATLAIGGAICLISSIFFAIKLPLLRKLIHPIYRRIGIITE